MREWRFIFVVFYRIEQEKEHRVFYTKHTTIMFCWFFVLPIINAFSLNKFPIHVLYDKIQHHDIHSLVFSPSLDYIIIQDNTPETTLSFFEPSLAKQVFDVSLENHISSYILPSLDLFMIPLVLYFTVWFFFFRQPFDPMNNLFTPFDQGISTEMYIPENVSTISFVGYDEVLEECQDLFPLNKTLYEIVGAELPKGILLEGPPGNGKTFLAKYIAQQSQSSFIAVSASEFVNMFVGMGANNVRQLFQDAREHAPCILFIDEIDSIGKRRTSGSLSSNDEKDQTLNQILTEMDGFTDNPGVLVIAATNRKELLDPALLRPGRFDRIIHLPLPDLSSRQAILEEHAITKRLDPDVDLMWVADFTAGFSGAQLKNLLNEAAILAARAGNMTILHVNIMDALEKLTVGLIRKTDVRNEVTKERVAVHETGHALLCIFFKEYFELQKVSIQSTYEGAGGYTLFKEVAEGEISTKDLLKKQLIVAMGGKAAENLFYGEDFVSLGAIQDLKKANALARDMICRFGMGDLLEPFYQETIDVKTGMSVEYAERTRLLVDKEAMILVTEALAEAKRILKENWGKCTKVKQLLLDSTVLYMDDLLCLEDTTIQHVIPISFDETFYS